MTDEKIIEAFSYCPITGILSRKGQYYKSGRFSAYDEPKVVSGLNSYGYVQVRLGQRTLLAHRIGWFLHHGYWPEVIDHINGNPSDNRMENLRDISQAENVQNQRHAKSNSTTGLLGVSFDKARGKFVAAVGIGGKRKFIGRFASVEEAHSAYVEKKREIHTASTL